MADRLESTKREGWSGGYCARCGHYAAQLQWCVCPRCRRTREGRALAAERKRAVLLVPEEVR